MTVEPLAVTAGDTVAWSRSGGDYPSPTWVLTYYYASVSHALAPVVATAGVNGAHDVAVSPAVTATWAPDTYTWQAKVADGTDVHTVDVGRLTVAPSLVSMSSIDSRAWAEKALDAIEAVMLGKASVDQQSYSIGGRAASAYTVEELVAWRDRLRSEVKQMERAARIARGENAGGRILVRF